MSEFDVSEHFARACLFLRVRSTANDGNNIKFQVPRADFESSTWIVDEGAGNKDWFRVQKIVMGDGRVLKGPGWVMKQYQGLPTLVQKPLHLCDAGSNCGRVRANLGNEAVARLQQGGRGGLNPVYARNAFQRQSAAVAGLPNGDIAWKYICEATVAPGQTRVRVVQRKVVVAERGHGLEVVQRMEHECLRADPVGSNTRPDILLFFLHSVQGAQEAHKKHGYKSLWKVGGLMLMYKQISGKGELNFSKLSEDLIVKFAKKFAEA
jgi:hypothetical protein